MAERNTKFPSNVDLMLSRHHIDGGPMLNVHCVNVSCLLGYDLFSASTDNSFSAMAHKL